MFTLGLSLMLVVSHWMSNHHVSCQSCTCDLVSNVCDLNCCCDPLCTDADKLSFERCDHIHQNRIEQVCVSESILFSSNGKYEAEGTASGLFCIFQDNYEARHFYSAVTAANTQSEFNNLAVKYPASAYETVLPPQPNYQESFKAGDPLFVLFDDNRQGYISVPIPFMSGQCDDQNAAKFLFNNKTQCSRQISNLPSQCNSERSWIVSSYVEGFRIAPFPSFVFGLTRFIEVANTSVNASVEMVNVNDSRLILPVVVLPLKCLSDGGIAADCPFDNLPTPVYDASTGICSNVVVEVGYNVNFTVNQTVELSGVQVNFVLGSIHKDSAYFQQKFSASFMENSIGNITNTTVLQRSGNPGYILGYPLVSGNSFIDFATSKTFIAVNQREPTWLSTIKSTASGVCETTLPRLTVLFGYDVKTGCFMRIQDVLTTDECRKLQVDILNLLLANLPSHIAAFGNSNGEILDEWVKVINVKPTSQTAVLNGQCENLITDVTYEVLYANTGFFSNPQPKIVGFQVKYGEARSLSLLCNGVVCKTPNTRKVEISQSVVFVDVSSTSQTEVKSKPEFKSKAPNDFFYPFL